MLTECSPQRSSSTVRVAESSPTMGILLQIVQMDDRGTLAVYPILRMNGT
jgi:hypothetical protein